MKIVHEEVKIIRLKKSMGSTKWHRNLLKNLKNLPEKFKFHIKRINLEGDRWLNLDKKDEK